MTLVAPEYATNIGNYAIVGNINLYLHGKSKTSSLNPFFKLIYLWLTVYNKGYQKYDKTNR